jgi:hypothetical protein
MQVANAASICGEQRQLRAVSEENRATFLVHSRLSDVIARHHCFDPKADQFAVKIFHGNVPDPTRGGWCLAASHQGHDLVLAVHRSFRYNSDTAQSNRGAK